jgi:hypothetical protein
MIDPEEIHLRLQNTNKLSKMIIEDIECKQKVKENWNDYANTE